MYRVQLRSWAQPTSLTASIFIVCRKRVVGEVNPTTANPPANPAATRLAVIHTLPFSFFALTSRILWLELSDVRQVYFLLLATATATTKTTPKTTTTATATAAEEQVR